MKLQSIFDDIDTDNSRNIDTTKVINLFHERLLYSINLLKSLSQILLLRRTVKISSKQQPYVTNRLSILMNGISLFLSCMLLINLHMRGSLRIMIRLLRRRVSLDYKEFEEKKKKKVEI